MDIEQIEKLLGHIYADRYTLGKQVASRKENRKHDLDFMERLAEAIIENAAEIATIVKAERVETFSRNFTELMPELLGEKAGIVNIPDSFWKPYDDYKEEQAKQA
jgi:hypothetical protein